jgi:hypothetical protein
MKALQHYIRYTNILFQLLSYKSSTETRVFVWNVNVLFRHAKYLIFLKAGLKNITRVVRTAYYFQIKWSPIIFIPV